MSAIAPLSVAVGYCRVSTERQASDDRTSLADQRIAIERLAMRLTVPIVEWFRDEGASGATAEKRPAFMQLLAYCERHVRRRGPVGYVLVLNDSRFGRFSDPAEATFWRFTLRRLGWVVRFAEGDDIADGVGREVVRLVGQGQAGEYRENIRQNARRGARSAAELGYWHQEAPLGYRRRVVHPPGRERVLDIGIRKAADERVQLTLGPEAEVALVRWMFAAYADGSHTLGDLVIALQHRWPARRWSRGTVSSVLRNPAYVGDVVGGRRSSDNPDGRHLHRPASEWYGKPDAHPALVSRAEFARVAARLRENAQRRRGARNEYLLSGLVRCSICGAPFIGGGGINRARDPKGSWKFYKDSGGHRRGSACYGSYGSIGRHILDRAVVETVSRLVSHPTVAGAIEQAIDELLEESRSTGSTLRARLERTRTDLTRRRDNLVAAVEAGSVTPGEAAHRLDALRRELRETEQALEGARTATREADVLVRERDRLLGMARDFSSLAARCDTGALRALILPWLHDAVFDRTTRRLILSIRRIPAELSMQSSTSPRPASRKQRAADTIERTIDLTQRAAKAAGWAR